MATVTIVNGSQPVFPLHFQSGIWLRRSARSELVRLTKPASSNPPNLVTTVGITYFDAKDIHSDTGLTAEAIYYSAAHWIVQGGTTYNLSHPGAVGSSSGYIALSHAVNGERIVSVRVGGGEQAYQPFADNRFNVGITFGTLRVSCKQWIGRHWGVNVVADGYWSSTYDQHGLEVGLFQEF